MAELAIAVIHGMGTEESDFADSMIEELNDRVRRKRKDPRKIAWQSIFWANVLDGRELKYLREANRQADLHAPELREFVVTALGDVVAYQKVTSTATTAYDSDTRAGQNRHPRPLCEGAGIAAETVAGLRSFSRWAHYVQLHLGHAAQGKGPVAAMTSPNRRRS